MATPDLFSDVASNPFEAKRAVDGDIKAQKANITVPNATAADTQIGMVRFQKGFSLTHLALAAANIGGASMTLDVGYVYDDATLTDDENAFVDGSTIGQAGGSLIWPVASGLLTGESFVAEGDGYLVVAIKDAVTDAEGDIYLIAQFTYDL